MAHDRGGGYGEAIAKALPDAVQVADRWHLMHNASQAFLDAVRKSMRQIRRVIGAATINADLLTCAERLQYEGYLRREETNAAIMALWKDGVSIRQIVKRTGHHRQTIRHIVRGERSDVFRPRQSPLEAHLPWLIRSGTPAPATQQRSGVNSGRRASGDQPGWWQNGRRGGGKPKKRTPRA